jgi:DNA invertase Pin-like site-specific DNA recombinase
MTEGQAVSYLRVSGLGQVHGDGFARQREAVEIRAKGLGLEIGQEFRDEGVSGTAPLQDRPGLTALVEHVARERAGTVLVERADRLARDLIEGELILREFRTLGVRVIEAEGGHDLTEGEGNPTAKLIRQVLGAVAEFEKSALVAKLRAARNRKRRAGERVEGRKPYPPEVVDQARRLRRRRHQGSPWSYARIADEMTRLGVPTKNGNPWSPSTISDLLKAKLALPRAT